MVSNPTLAPICAVVGLGDPVEHQQRHKIYKLKIINHEKTIFYCITPYTSL